MPKKNKTVKSKTPDERWQAIAWAELSDLLGPRRDLVEEARRVIMKIERFKERLEDIQLRVQIKKMLMNEILNDWVKE